MPNRKSIREKTHKDVGAPLATRIFTDRKNLRQSFHDMVEKAIDHEFEEYYVMHYYGNCGVGKTALLNQLEKELRDQDKKTIILHIDFKNLGHAEEITIFDELQRQLCAQMSNISFPLYTAACLLMRRAEGKPIDANITKQSFVDNPGLAMITDILEEATGIGFIHIAMNAVSFTKPVKDFINKNREYYKKCISHMQNMQADEIRRNLAYYFSVDINEYSHTPIFMFFDTYEAYASDPEKDEWLHGEKGLIRNMGDTVFVIAGQVKLKWQQHDFWRQHVESHLVQNLSPDDSRRFLLSCCVEDEHLREEIFQLTKGSPLWLDLCVAQYYNLHSHGMTPDIETIGHEKKELVERHLYYVPKYLHDVYHLLAGMKCWTEDLAIFLLRELNISVSPTEYNDILHQPYIDHNEELHLYTMSDEIAIVLASRLTEVFRRKAIEIIVKYLQDKMPALPINDTPLNENELRRKENLFETAWKALLNLAEERYLTTKPIDIMLNYANYLRMRFSYSKAEEYLRQAVDLYQKLLNENDEPIRFAKSRLGEVLHRAGKTEDAIQIYEELLKTCSASTNKNHDYMSVKNNLANYYMSIGKKRILHSCCGRKSCHSVYLNTGKITRILGMRKIIWHVHICRSNDLKKQQVYSKGYMKSTKRFLEKRIGVPLEKNLIWEMLILYYLLMAIQSTFQKQENYCTMH